MKSVVGRCRLSLSL